MAYDFDPNKYASKSKYPRGSASGKPVADESRERMLGLISKKQNRANQEQRFQLQQMAEAKARAANARKSNERGWGKLGMLGAGIGSMFGGPGMGAAIGSGLGLLRATKSRMKGGANPIGGFLGSVTDIGGGIVDPIAENPWQALMLAGAMKKAGAFKGLGDLFSGSGSSEGFSMGDGGFEGDYDLGDAGYDPYADFDSDMSFDLKKPGF